jgi:cell division septation protein DedD
MIIILPIKRLCAFFTAFILSTMILCAQSTDNIVRSKLRQVALGNASDVRAELPELSRTYPNDAGVQFLSATLTADGVKALPLFVRIVRENPQSIWVDDAQWRVVQIYALRKDTASARSELQNFRRNYPSSEFLLFAAEIVKSTVGLPPTFTTYRNPIIVASTVRTIPSSTILKPKTDPSETEPSKTEPTKAEAAKATSSASVQKVESKPEPVLQQEIASSKTVAGERYTLQVGIYSSRESAIIDVQKLLKARLRSDVIEKNTEGAARFAVMVGNYASREAAEKAKAIVQKACTCVPFVVVK